MDEREFEKWRQELIRTGIIVEDSDRSVSDDERSRMADRYLELVERVEGNEGIPTYCALVESLQAEDDYGIYQSTFRALNRFPDRIAAEGLVNALPALIQRQPEWAGDLLCGLSEGQIAAFNQALSRAPDGDRIAIMEFVVREEESGWLEDMVGEIRPAEG